jgi:hypothetical protein
MLMEYQANNIAHPSLLVEGKWLGNSFDDFLQRIPKEHLCNQLYMFSAGYDIQEAVERVKGLSHYFFTEDFDKGVDMINGKLGLSLKATHMRKTTYKADIPQGSLEVLREMVVAEYEFLSRLKNIGRNEK